MKIIIILFIVLLVIVISIVAYTAIKKKNKLLDYYSYLDSIKPDFIFIAVEIIDNSNPEKYFSMVDYIDNMSTSLKDKFINSIKIDSSIYKYYTEEYISNINHKYIESVINTDIMQNIMDKYSSIDSNDYLEEIEKEDLELQKKFSDSSLYIEELDLSELESAQQIIPTEEELSNINPPKDEEDEFINEDIEEIIDESKPIIIINTDKNGNELYFEIIDGKKRRVSKKYASQYI